jgi:hypothetical protein
MVAVGQILQVSDCICFAGFGLRPFDRGAVEPTIVWHFLCQVYKLDTEAPDSCGFDSASIEKSQTETGKTDAVRNL